MWDEHPGQRSKYKRSWTPGAEGHKSPMSFRGQGQSVRYEAEQTLNSMETILPGKWLDDIPAITGDRSAPNNDHRSKATTEYQRGSSPDKKPPIDATADTLLPLASLLKV